MAPRPDFRAAIRRETERAWPLTLAVATGILGAVGNLVFRETIAGATRLFHAIASPFGRPGIPLSLVAGGLVLLLLDRVFPGEVLGYGFPRFLEMVHLQGARVKRRWMVVKTLGAAVSLGSGAAVGREGPIAQIGGSIGSAVALLARVSGEQRRILVACGAAAGIATTFNAPLGALMFAHEIVLLGEVHLPNFILIVIATTTGVIFSRSVLGSAPVFTVPPFAVESYWEGITYGLLGLLLGVLAAGYTRFFHAVAARLRRLAWPRAVVLVAGLAAVGLLDAAVPGNLSDGYEVVNQALAGRLSGPTMATLAGAKIVGSSLSLGCGAPGGVFGPIFFIGAMTGGAFRTVSALVAPGLTGPRGSYALVGLGAFLAATTHAPLTAIFLLFEMTQTYTVTVPALITTILALMVATRLEPESIDTLGLTAEGKSLHPTSDQRLLERIPVETVYRREFDAIPEDCPLPEVARLVSGGRGATFPVVDAAGELAGILSFAALRTLLIEEKPDARLIVARDLADPPPPPLTPQDGLGEAFRRLESAGVEELPVVDPANPRRLLGLISRAELIAAYNRTVATLSAPPMPGWLKGSEFQWADRFRVLPVEVPRHWVGRTLREIDCRARWGVTVLAVHAAGQGAGEAYELPDPDRRLEAADVLVLAGTAEALRLARAA
jgi:CIC family chloride channel protein